MSIYPKTTAGWWSVCSIILMPILITIGRITYQNYYTNIPAGNSIPEDIVQRPGIAFPMLCGILAGISAGIAGGATIHNKERSPIVYISTFLGLLVILFVFGEFLFPH